MYNIFVIHRNDFKVVTKYCFFLFVYYQPNDGEKIYQGLNSINQSEIMSQSYIGPTRHTAPNQF